MHSPETPAPLRLLDLSDRVKLRLRGGDRVRYLQGQVTNDVRRATATESVYACVLTAKGKLCADVFICAGPDFLMLDAEPSLRESLAARLERYLIADDVEIEDVTETLGLFHLLGVSPESALATGPLQAVSAMPPVRSNRFGQPGVDVFFEPAAGPTLKAALLAASTGGQELDPAAAEQLRIAAGVPRWGMELDENILPPEAALEARAIDYAKGCYVGQEVISRLKSLGRVNRHLCRLSTLGPDPAPLAAGMVLRRAPVDDAVGDNPAAEVGRITSATLADHGGYLALGYVRRGEETPGTRLRAVDSPAAPAAAGGEVEVTGSPFSPP